MVTKLMIVYILQCGNYVKIGRSTNLAARLSNIQAENPIPLTVLLKTTKYKESELVEKFKQYKTENDWFVLSDEIRKFVTQEQAQVLDIGDILPTPQIRDVLEAVIATAKIIGTDRYSADVTDIVQQYNIHHTAISEKSMYRYLRTLHDADYLKKSRETLRLFKQIPRESVSHSAFFEDQHSKAIPIVDLPEYIFIENGEKSLPIYTITEKGKQLLQGEKNE